MSNITLNNVKENIASQVQSCLDYKVLEITSDMDKDDILQVINEQLEDENIHYDVTYYHEAWEICRSQEFPGADDCDFTGITSASDAVMREAQAIISQIEYEAIGEAVEEVAERFAEICETAADLGYDGKMHVSHGDNYGWNAHDYETNDGTCVHKNLESEKGLTAVVGCHEDVYLSACFTVEA